MSKKNTFAHAAAALGLTVEQVVQQTQALRDGAASNLMIAQTMSKPHVLFLLDRAGAKAFVNLNDLSRPYGPDKASLVADLGDAMLTMIDRKAPMDIILHARVGNAVEVLTQEVEFYDRLLAEHRASEEPLDAAA